MIVRDSEDVAACQAWEVLANAKRDGGGRQAADEREALSPRAVTRGEERRASIDWLHATFDEPTLSPEGFVGLFSSMLGRPVSAVPGPGSMGFKSSLKLHAHIGSRTAPIGQLAMGGDSQNGRWLLQITGGGCGLFDEWGSVQQLLEDLDARITRVDLAVDMPGGEWGVDDAVTVYESGGFAFDGKTQPSHKLVGDWLGGDAGRTLYVGKSKNGKMLRVYEKGKQLGDRESEWVRFEVQLGNRDRVIPYDVLTSPDKYFAGAYPALADLLHDVVPEQINTAQKGGETTIAHALFHLRRSYGKWIDATTEATAVDYAELLEEVRVIGIPRRLSASSAAARLSWEELLSQMQRK